MTVQTDFLKRSKALNLHDGKLSDWLDEIESLRQQLAEAQAACSMKDELITDACTALAFYGEHPPEELFLAITIKPGIEALEKWLGDPAFYVISFEKDIRAWRNGPANGYEPLYAKPKGIS